MNRTLTRQTISLPSSEVSVVLNKNGVLINEEGPVYDVLRLNTMDCKSVEVDGIQYFPERTGTDLADMSEPTILHPALAALADKPALGITVKRKIPKRNLMEARTIMQLVYEKHHTEVMVFILFNKRTGEFITTVPKQEVSSAACTVQAEDSVEQQSADVIMAADFHSHPFGGGSGFLSGTDHANHDSYPDVPIASFNFSGTAIAGALYHFGKLKCEFGEIPLEMEDFCETPDECINITQADRDKWDPIITEKVHTRTYTTTYGSYGAAGYSGYDYFKGRGSSYGWGDDDDDCVPGIVPGREAKSVSERGKNGGKKSSKSRLGSGKKFKTEPANPNRSARGHVTSTVADNVWVNGKRVTFPDYVDLGELYAMLEDCAKELLIEKSEGSPIVTAESIEAYRSGFDQGFDDPFLDEQLEGIDVVEDAENFLKDQYLRSVKGSYLAIDEWPKSKQRDVDAILLLIDNVGCYTCEDINQVKYPTLYGFMNELEKSPTARAQLAYVPMLFVAMLFAFGTVGSDTAGLIRAEFENWIKEIIDDAAQADAIRAEIRDREAIADAKEADAEPEADDDDKK